MEKTTKATAVKTTETKVPVNKKVLTSDYFNFENLAENVKVDTDKVNAEGNVFELPIEINLNKAFSVPDSELRNTKQKSMNAKSYKGVVKYTRYDEKAEKYAMSVILENFNIANVVKKTTLWKIGYQIHRQITAKIRTLKQAEESAEKKS